jgi:hypothetical protein
MCVCVLGIIYSILICMIVLKKPCDVFESLLVLFESAIIVLALKNNMIQMSISTERYCFLFKKSLTTIPSLCFLFRF